ncbi:hypothetical protein D3C81_1592850 [compost metagenome]
MSYPYEYPDQPDSCQILLNDFIHLIESSLDFTEIRSRYPHHPHYKHNQKWNSQNKQQPQLYIHNKCHQDAAKYDKRHPGCEPETHEDHILQLGNVPGQPRDQGGGFEPAKYGIGKRLHLVIQLVPQIECKALAGMGSEERTRDSGEESDDRTSEQHAAPQPYDG